MVAWVNVSRPIIRLAGFIGNVMDIEHFQGHRIIFEGHELPKAALHLDHLGMYGNLPGISDETSEWLWRFPICLGHTREDSSDRVIRYASETLQLCLQHKDHLLANFAAHFAGKLEPVFYDDWVWCLNHMISIAKDRPQCHWVAPLIPGDENYGRSKVDNLSVMAAKIEHAIEKTNVKDC